MLPRRFAGELFQGMEFSPADKTKVVQLYDMDDTLTRKPEGFDNSGLTKDQFFDAARDFPADEAVADLARLLHSKGDAIAIATARPAERLEETIDWLRKNSIPFDDVMLSNGSEASGVTKQEMIQAMQDKYRMVGTLFDDSQFNIEGANLQGVDAVHLLKNEDYWAQHPENVWRHIR